MSAVARWPGRHPLCTCPELTFAMIEKGLAPDRSKCAGGTIAHPVLSADDLTALAALWDQGRFRPASLWSGA